MNLTVTLVTEGAVEGGSPDGHYLHLSEKAAMIVAKNCFLGVGEYDDLLPGFEVISHRGITTNMADDQWYVAVIYKRVGV